MANVLLILILGMLFVSAKAHIAKNEAEFDEMVQALGDIMMELEKSDVPAEKELTETLKTDEKTVPATGRDKNGRFCKKQ